MICEYCCSFLALAYLKLCGFKCFSVEHVDLCGSMIYVGPDRSFEVCAKSKGADWPLWVREQEMVHELFRTMQPFEDEYDVGKAWGTDATCKNMGFN